MDEAMKKYTDLFVKVMKNLFIFFFVLFPLFLFSQDLTGVWTCNDGATYYLRQINNELWWYGNGGSTFTNVFHGKIHGKNIYGDWSDVPAGTDRNSGFMTVEIISTNKLERTWSSGQFGGSIWTRGGALVTNLGGQWTYAGTRGKISTQQSGNQVTMELTIQPRTTPAPHYVVNAIINGNMLEGTWEFKVRNDPDFSGSNCQGGKFYAEVSPDKKRITVLNNTEDPCNHDWAGTVFYRQ